MARPLKPLVRGGGYYPSNGWTPLVYPGGYTTADGGEQPVSIVWKTMSGNAPITITDAIAYPVRSLIQQGNCESVDGDIFCNNGKIVAVDDELPIAYKRITGIKFDGDFWYDTGEVLTGDDNVTMTLANTSVSGQNVFGSYNGTGSSAKNFSLYIYGGGSSSNCYFRYGSQLVRPRFGSNEHTITFGHDGTSGFDVDVSVTPDEFTTVAQAFIGMLPNSSSAAYTGSIMGEITVGTRLKWIPCERQSDSEIGYYEAMSGAFIEKTGTGTPIAGSYDTSHLNAYIVEGTAEVLTLGTQTASVANLFEYNNIYDEQNIISGTITRRVSVSASGGVITIAPLDEPITERVQAQPMNTDEALNTVSVTGNIGAVPLTIEYATSGE